MCPEDQGAKEYNISTRTMLKEAFRIQIPPLAQWLNACSSMSSMYFSVLIFTP